MFVVNFGLAWCLLYAKEVKCTNVKDSPVISSIFFLSSPQWSAASAQIQSGEFFLHSSPLVRATAATGWPYPRLLSVLPESGWSRKPTESTTSPWGQILWILEFLGKHSVFEIPKGSFRRRAFTSLSKGVLSWYFELFWPRKKFIFKLKGTYE